MADRPIVLIILDGWGIPSDLSRGVFGRARIPFYRGLLDRYPHTSLKASGEAVGLPEGQMGNSEVGHLNLGAGRIVYQDYTRINMAVAEGSLRDNPVVRAVAEASRGGTLHLAGLLSDGGVHSHISHLKGLLEAVTVLGARRVRVHAFLDGRDTPPSSGLGYVEDIERFLGEFPDARIATVAGRYWAMDRDHRWDRVAKAYEALVAGKGNTATSAAEAVRRAYDAGETDEFVKPTVVLRAGKPEGLVDDGDAFFFFNFRADRARELSEALTRERDFTGFARSKVPRLALFATMTAYDETFPFEVAFPPVRLTNILGEIVSGQGLRQLRIAETEKYAHVTYFFNGGEEEPFPGEDRFLINSPQDVATYDQKPEMSAPEVTEELLRRIDSGDYDLIVVNYANPDMVGHTGVLAAAVKACETVDACLEKVVPEVVAKGGTVLVTADHGNSELMVEDDGDPVTAHSTNPVPLILTRAGLRLREGGMLGDVAPTILDLLGVPIPEEMTGRSLIVHGDGDIGTGGMIR